MFKDLIVLELANVLAGPAVGMFFAELGATVIKVENPATMGDVTRSWKLRGESRDNDISSYFSSVNWGKQSIAVNVEVAEGLEIVHQLARRADVVIASYKPGDDRKLKLDYQTLSRLNPSLIYAQISGYGLEDRRVGYDAILQASSGFTYMNGEPQGAPVKMPVALIDLLTAHQLKEAILLALIQRMSSGKGAFVHSSLLQSGIASLANQAANWLVAGEIPQRIGSDHPNIVPYGSVFRTRDGKEVVLAVGNDRQFAALCEVLGRPELAALPLYSTNPQRVVHREKLKTLLTERIAQFDRDPLLASLSEKKVPAGGILNMKEVMEQRAALDLMVKATDNKGREIAGLRTVAFQSSSSRRRKLSAPPHLNEHAEVLLTDLLGYPPEQIRRMKRAGAILWV